MVSMEDNIHSSALLEQISQLEREKKEALEECVALKLQFKSLKNRVVAADEEVRQVREKGLEELSSTQQKVKTQEQVLKYLRDRVEECELENQELHEEMKSVREQKKRAEEKLSQLQRDIARKEVEVVGKIQEEGELKEELEALRAQSVKLKEQLIQVREELSARLLEGQKLQSALQEELKGVKERSGKEFEREREALLEEMRLLKRRCDGMTQLEVLKKETEERLKECQKRLDDAILVKQQMEQELRSFKEALKQKEHLLEESKSKIARFQQEKYEAEGRFSEYRTVLETLEGDLKQAKLHLAKKLKETNQTKREMRRLRRKELFNSRASGQRRGL